MAELLFLCALIGVPVLVVGVLADLPLMVKVGAFLLAWPAIYLLVEGMS